MARAQTEATPPAKVVEFVEAIKANAREAWGDNILTENPVHVSQSEDGRTWTVGDNYERFFHQIYVYFVDSNEWSLRYMYSGESEKPYSFEKAMADASIMYTG